MDQPENLVEFVKKRENYSYHVDFLRVNIRTNLLYSWSLFALEHGFMVGEVEEEDLWMD